jgi:hypothetical protein
MGLSILKNDVFENGQRVVWYMCTYTPEVAAVSSYSSNLDDGSSKLLRNLLKFLGRLQIFTFTNISNFIVTAEIVSSLASPAVLINTILSLSLCVPVK